jgi:hypothetical protein
MIFHFGSRAFQSRYPMLLSPNLQLMSVLMLSNDESGKDPNTQTSMPPLIKPDDGNIDEIETLETNVNIRPLL